MGGFRYARRRRACLPLGYDDATDARSRIPSHLAGIGYAVLFRASQLPCALPHDPPVTVAESSPALSCCIPSRVSSAIASPREPDGNRFILGSLRSPSRFGGSAPNALQLVTSVKCRCVELFRSEGPVRVARYLASPPVASS